MVPDRVRGLCPHCGAELSVPGSGGSPRSDTVSGLTVTAAAASLVLFAGLHLALRTEPAPGLALVVAAGAVSLWLVGMGVLAASEAPHGPRSFGPRLKAILSSTRERWLVALWPLVAAASALGLAILVGLTALPLTTGAPVLVSALSLSLGLACAAGILVVGVVAVACQFVRILRMSNRLPRGRLREDLRIWFTAERTWLLPAFGRFVGLGLAGLSGALAAVFLGLKLYLAAQPDRVAELLGPSPLGVLFGIEPPTDAPISVQLAALVVTLASALVAGLGAVPALAYWARVPGTEIGMDEDRRQAGAPPTNAT